MMWDQWGNGYGMGWGWFGAMHLLWWLLLIAALLLFVTEAILARRTKMARVIN